MGSSFPLARKSVSDAFMTAVEKPKEDPVLALLAATGTLNGIHRLDLPAA